MKWIPNPFVNKAGQPVFFMRKLFGFRGWSVRLHKFTQGDDEGCYHSHPAVAYRLILWGGYVEETPDGKWHNCNWLHVSKITPDFVHRIDHLHGKSSISLWIRGPITHQVQYGCVD